MKASMGVRGWYAAGRPSQVRNRTRRAAPAWPLGTEPEEYVVRQWCTAEPHDSVPLGSECFSVERGCWGPGSPWLNRCYLRKCHPRPPFGLGGEPRAAAPLLGTWREK